MGELITGESLCRMICNAKTIEEKQSAFAKVIELGSNIEEPLAYLAVVYAYSHTKDDKAKALPFYEKWETNPIFYDGLIYPEHLYLEISEIYEKEFQFDKTIECLDKYFDELYKDCKIISKNRQTNYGSLHDGEIVYDVVKFLIYRSEDGEADFYYQFVRLGEFYLKMGTQYAMDYWYSLSASPFFEENSEFKNMVELYYSIAAHKQEDGYIYKPRSKADQAKFLAYAKEKGWR